MVIYVVSNTTECRGCVSLSSTSLPSMQDELGDASTIPSNLASFRCMRIFAESIQDRPPFRSRLDTTIQYERNFFSNGNRNFCGSVSVSKEVSNRRIGVVATRMSAEAEQEWRVLCAFRQRAPAKEASELQRDAWN